MKVWSVRQDNGGAHEPESIESVWTTEAQAQERADYLNARVPTDHLYLGSGWSIAPFHLDVVGEDIN